MEISPDEKYLASAHTTGFASLWHLENLRHIYDYNFTKSVDRVSFSISGAYVAVIDAKSQIDI